MCIRDSNNRGQLIGKAKARLTKRISTRLSGTTLCKNGVSFSGDKVSASASIRFLIPVWGSREYTGTALSLIHILATRFYDDGVSIQTIRDYLGHFSEEMTKQYVDVMPKRIEKASDAYFKKPGNDLASAITVKKRGDKK